MAGVCGEVCGCGLAGTCSVAACAWETPPANASKQDRTTIARQPANDKRIFMKPFVKYNVSTRREMIMPVLEIR
jgi:hypothetical protein